jgi:hypothetical protein
VIECRLELKIARVEKVTTGKTPENLINKTNETSIKMQINILGGFLFLLDCLCRDFCSPYRGVTPRHTLTIYLNGNF